LGVGLFEGVEVGEVVGDSEEVGDTEGLSVGDTAGETDGEEVVGDTKGPPDGEIAAGDPDGDVVGEVKIGDSVTLGASEEHFSLQFAGQKNFTVGIAGTRLFSPASIVTISCPCTIPSCVISIKKISIIFT
jgi:hypothetical protein